jgi:two-component system, chemotaxis family, protein-glutamate methylesterase/glutaminase
MSTRVLVVDDSPLSQRWLRELLATDAEFAVVGTASNGLQALEAAQALRPDLVTLDLKMPVMDGLATLKHLMSARPIRTVVVSQLAAAESHLTFDCLRYGAVDFIRKPSSLEGAARDAEPGEIVLRLRRAAAVAPSRLRFQRLRARPGAGAIVGHEAAGHLILALAGRSGMAELLQLVAAVPRRAGLGLLALVDVSPAVAESFAAYAVRFSDFAPGTGEADATVRGGAAHFVSTGDPVLCVSDGSCCRLKPFSPPLGAERESLPAAMLASAAEGFGGRLDVVLLSGAVAGCLDGLGGVVAGGGRVWAQEPDEAVENATLLRAVESGLAARIGSWSEWGEGVASGIVAAPK